MFDILQSHDHLIKPRPNKRDRFQKIRKLWVVGPTKTFLILEKKKSMRIIGRSFPNENIHLQPAVWF